MSVTHTDSRRRVLWTAAITAAVAAAVVWAQPPGLPLWSTIDSGGGRIGGGGFSLVGSVGQFDAGRSTGGAFALRGGYIGGGGHVTAVDPPDDSAPVPVFRFHPVTPNPFNPSTAIAFDLPKADRVSLRIYNVRGQLVDTLVNAEVPAGRYRHVWRGTDLRGQEVASGVYLVSFNSSEHHIRRKITLVR